MPFQWAQSRFFVAGLSAAISWPWLPSQCALVHHATSLWARRRCIASSWGVMRQLFFDPTGAPSQKLLGIISFVVMRVCPDSYFPQLACGLRESSTHDQTSIQCGHPFRLEPHLGLHLAIYACPGFLRKASSAASLTRPMATEPKAAAIGAWPSLQLEEELCSPYCPYKSAKH